MKKENKVNKLKKINIFLIVASSTALALFVMTAVLYGISIARTNMLANTISSAYQKNYYELVDNISNAETKLSKAIVSGDDDYAKKMLYEVSRSSARAGANLSALPISANGLNQTINFINKVDGLTTSYIQKLENGETLTNADIQVLSKVYESLVGIKSGLIEFNKKVHNGYDILDESLNLSGDYNSFTTSIGNVSSDIDYPSMIYDGPFSDSTISKDVVGLEYEEVQREEAKQKLIDYIEDTSEDMISSAGETAGRIATYDFNIKISDNEQYFVQVSKKGARLITMSSYVENVSTNVTLSSAISTGKAFLQNMELDNFECVWSDIISGTAVLNFAPVVSNTIIYPDLIKIKIELGEGNIIGYDATTYYTNHTNREIESASYGMVNAQNKISEDFNIVNKRVVLAPLDYNREVLCYEFECTKDGATYYFFYNAESGKQENILKVIEDGNKLI